MMFGFGSFLSMDLDRVYSLVSCSSIEACSEEEGQVKADVSVIPSFCKNEVVKT